MKKFTLSLKKEHRQGLIKENDMSDIPRDMENGTKEVSRRHHESSATPLGRAGDIPSRNEKHETDRYDQDEAFESEGISSPL